MFLKDSKARRVSKSLSTANGLQARRCYLKLIIVEPEKTYRLSFAVKTKDLVTGGPPYIAVRDATNNQLLGKSENLLTPCWFTLNIDFTTLPNSQATIIRLERNNCDASCPIFGTLWLDQFRIEQTKPAVKQ